MANVLLLRAPSQGQDDRYESIFSEAGYHPISVPVLETISTNLPTLESIIEAGPTGPIGQGLEGVIFTSARSCEAWKTVVENLAGGMVKGNWSDVPFYVVGPGTASVLRELHRLYGSTQFTSQDIRGEESGTGERLADFIRHQDKRPQKLLYLTGDKNRDTVPTILEGAGIQLRTLKVYETDNSHTFERDLKDAMRRVSTVSDRWWIVHFAPSAAGFVMPILNKHFNFQPVDPEAEKVLSSFRPKIAAIGPTTSTFLRNDLHVHVDVVPEHPTPQDLASAVVAHDLQWEIEAEG